MNINQIKKRWVIIAFFIVISAFFLNLFIPEPSIYVTPEYGRSDLYHFNVPLRKTVSESLKNFEIPFWEPGIGQGFPIFDEGQMGLFYLPNLILLFFLPFPLSYNIGYIVSFFIAASGMYLLARSLDLNKPASYLAGITYAFSPIMVLHLQHYNLIQTVAIAPWLFWLLNSFFKEKKIIHLAIFSLVLSQQIFAGFYQIVLYSLTGLIIFSIFKVLAYSNNKLRQIKVTLLIITFTLFGFLIAFVQLGATYNLVQQSQRLEISSPQLNLSQFPFKPSNLLTLINPYFLGSPKDATYPLWEPGKWGIFWESNTYFGIIQTILILIFIILIIFKKISLRPPNNVWIWLSLGLLGILLALGSLAPLHPIFSIPPFSFFRVPSRFLIFSFISASILSAYALNSIFKKGNKIPVILITTIILILITVDIFRVWFNYQLREKYDKWTSPPEITSEIKDSGRIASFGDLETWNKTYTNVGWKNQSDSYLFFKNFVPQNANLFSNITHVEVYAGMITKRQAIIAIDNLTKLKSQSPVNDEINNMVVQDQKILDFNNVEYLIVNEKTSFPSLELVKNYKYKENNIYLYKNLDVLPHVYTVTDYKIANTIEKFRKILKSNKFNPQETVVLEKIPEFTPTLQNAINKTEIVNYQKTRVEIETDLQTESIVVLSDSFYPGWHAEIDNKPTEILAANINSRAVIVPKGKHKIIYQYRPINFKLNTTISIISIIIVLLIIIKNKKSTLTI